MPERGLKVGHGFVEPMQILVESAPLDECLCSFLHPDRNSQQIDGAFWIVVLVDGGQDKLGIALEKEVVFIHGDQRLENLDGFLCYNTRSRNKKTDKKILKDSLRTSVQS